LLTPGARLGAAQIAVVAAAGLAQVQVTRRPRIIAITTGDELIEPGEPLQSWQIRRSNAYAILAALQDAGFPAVTNTHLLDDPASMRKRLEKCLEEHDVLVLSGGVSMGRFDYVPQILAALGVQQVFHKIAQRPGLPMWFGTRKEDGKTAY